MAVIANIVKCLIMGGALLPLAMSCSNIDDFETRLNKIEKDVNYDQPRLHQLEFLMEFNPKQLTTDVRGEIVGDSIVECWIPNITNDKLLIPQVDYLGDSVFFDGTLLGDNSQRIDFKKPVNMTIKKDLKKKEYNVYVHSYTGLPVMWIETENRDDITSKEIYLRASFKLTEDVVTRSAGDVLIDSVSIRGRGNTTWTVWPKKQYRLKFDKKVSLLNEPKDKSWVLVPNYHDKTMMRNEVAYYMGQISTLDYTPRCHFVELMLNGRYHGTYLLCEKLEIAKHRVNVGDDGFLIEVDGFAEEESDSRYFKVDHLEFPVNIKDPDVEYGDDKFNYIKSYVIHADSVLHSDGFDNPVSGWQKYLDMESFVDWYLINEITKNIDGERRSAFMNIEKNGKLKKGPLWDFDGALGNCKMLDCGNPHGFFVKNYGWYIRLFEDPNFVKKVKERFDYFYNRRFDIYKHINENTSYLKYSAQENENRWHVFYDYTWPNYDIWGSYNNEVQSMKEWLDARFEWLKSEFDKM